jgi:hypothetical protein
VNDESQDASCINRGSAAVAAPPITSDEEAMARVHKSRLEWIKGLPTYSPQTFLHHLVFSLVLSGHIIADELGV